MIGLNDFQGVWILAEEKEKKSKRGSVKSVIVLAALAAAGILVLVFAGNSKPAPYEAPVSPVEISRASKGTVELSITLSDYVEAKSVIPVVPFVNGTIMEYNVRAGDFVEKDFLIAKIDDAPYSQQMLQARAAYYGYQTTYERVCNLYKAGAATQQNYDSAKAQRDASKAQYELAKVQLDYTNVKAPVSGTVLMADMSVGSIGSTGQPVAVIADLSEQVIRLSVPEKYFDLFQMQKDSIRMSVTRPAQKGLYEDAVSSCTIENISPYISAESKNFQVVCRIDEPGERFRPGMFVKVKAVYRTYDDVYVLPLSVQKMDGGLYIYSEESSSVKYLDLKELPHDEKNFVVPDEYRDSWFVSDGQNIIFDGQTVRVAGRNG